MPLPFSFQVHHFQELASTNAYALAESRAGAAEGQVYVAEYQTQGRGQHGRKWLSPPGKNLLFSILLRPPISPQKAPLISSLAGSAVAKVLRIHYGLTPTLKRPNDVLIDGKKICGILIESVSDLHKMEAVVIGIGLNVNACPPVSEVPDAASLKNCTGREVPLQALLDQLLNQLGEDLKDLYAYPI